MRELKTNLSFIHRGTGEYLQETITYFIPECGDSWELVRAKPSDDIKVVRVYERRFIPTENRVVVYVDIVNS